jgi:uncharacterized protein (TIGR02678 family)
MTDRVDAERVDAARVLLAHPLVAAHGRHGHALPLIRRHHDALESQLRQLLGYRLVVEPSFARLYKTGLGRGRGRPLRRSSGAPWSPRTYAYLSLVIATLLTSRMQVLLSHLVDDVRAAAVEAGVELGDSTGERRDLVAALRQLVEWGAIEEDEGHVEGLAADASSEALLFVRHEIVRNLLAVPIRDVDSPEVLVDLAAAPGPGGVRHHARRLLVETPAVLADDLDNEAWSWLRQSQRREQDVIAEAFGLELEIRAEGVAAIDAREELTDEPFPRQGSLGHAALLTVRTLVERHAPEQPSGRAVPLPAEALDKAVEQVADRYGHRFKQAYRDDRMLLRRDVEDLLTTVELLRADGDGALWLRAVAARFAPEVVEAAQPTLFGKDDGGHR